MHHGGRILAEDAQPKRLLLRIDHADYYHKTGTQQSWQQGPEYLLLHSVIVPSAREHLPSSRDRPACGCHRAPSFAIVRCLGPLERNVYRKGARPGHAVQLHSVLRSSGDLEPVMSAVEMPQPQLARPSSARAPRQSRWCSSGAHQHVPCGATPSPQRLGSTSRRHHKPPAH